jgi:hypothetical protein
MLLINILFLEERIPIEMTCRSGKIPKGCYGKP